MQGSLSGNAWDWLAKQNKTKQNKKKKKTLQYFNKERRALSATFPVNYFT
jgi:hypothetical protein